MTSTMKSVSSKTLSTCLSTHVRKRNRQLIRASVARTPTSSVSDSSVDEQSDGGATTMSKTKTLGKQHATEKGIHHEASWRAERPRALGLEPQAALLVLAAVALVAAGGWAITHVVPQGGTPPAPVATTAPQVLGQSVNWKIGLTQVVGVAVGGVVTYEVGRAKLRSLKERAALAARKAAPRALLLGVAAVTAYVLLADK